MSTCSSLTAARAGTTRATSTGHVDPSRAARTNRTNRTTRAAAQQQRQQQCTQHVEPGQQLWIGRREGLLALGAALVGSAARPATARPLSVVDIDRAKPGERDVFTNSSGVKFADVQRGTGEVAKSGDLVLINLVGSLEDGQVFIDTREIGTPLAFQVGTTNKYVPEGVSHLVEGMSRGSIRLAVLPPDQAYSSKGVSMPGGKVVPPNARVFYEVELLRCQNFTLGLACCSEQTWASKGGNCILDPPKAQAGAGEAAPGAQ